MHHSYSLKASMLGMCLGLGLFACQHNPQNFADKHDLEDETSSAELGQRRRRDAGSADAGSADAGASSDGGSSASDAGSRDAGTSAASKWVLGYYAAYQRDLYTPAEIDWSGLTHIILTRIKTDGGGRLQLDFDVDNTNGPILARDIAQRAHQNGKKALMMLGGAGGGAGILDSASDQNRATFVNNLLQAVKDLGYDGLDLDWEDNVDWDRFIALARDLRNSPNKPANLILTMPGNTVNPNIGSVEPKIVQIVSYLDQFSVMSYYPATALAGWGWLSWHNSPLSGAKSQTPVSIEDSLSRYAAAGIPRAKLNMGVGFYAICYTGGVTAPNQSTENGVTIEGGDNDFPLSLLFANGGVYNASYRKWDSAAQVPYLTLPSPESHGCRYVSFDDEQSLEAKGAFAKANGYGGIIVWTINQGWLKNSAKAPNALMQALKRGFID